MEGVQVGTLYKLSIKPVIPTQIDKIVPSAPSTAFTTTVMPNADLALWHNRMAHINVKVIKSMSTHRSLADFFVAPSDHLLSVCRGCVLGKQHKATYPSNPQKERSKIPGELLHADLCGKMSQPSLRGARYYILIKDDCTSYRFVAFLRTKNEAIRFFIKVIRYIVNTTGNRIKTIRTDCGKEFCNTEFDLLLEREGIIRETSTSYTPQQNGYVERDNRTICEAARSMLHLHDVPLKLWAEAIHTVVHILNRTVNTQVGHTTPYELWFHRKPSVSHYRTFGTLAYILVDKSLRTKFQPKGTSVIFVGYSDTSKGWRFWNPRTDTVTESSDVLFDENTGYSSMFSSPSVSSPEFPLFPSLQIDNPPPPPTQIEPPIESSSISIPDSVGVAPSTTANDNSHTVSPARDPSPPLSSLPPTTSSNPGILPFIPDISSSSPISTASDPYDLDAPSTFTTVPTPLLDEPVHPRYRSISDLYSEPPSIAVDPDPLPESNQFSFANMIHTAETYREPSTYKAATMSPQAALWKAAMEREYDSLMENRTWILVPPPPGRNIIKCKWVYKVKYTSSGAVDKYKARLVAKGYNQVHGIDYEETFSPVIKHDSVRVLFAIASVLRMHMRQFDIGTAYLNSDLTTRIYMHQPEGFINSKHPSHVCLLLKSLYGLKQSGRLWNHTFDAFLKLYDLLTSDADTCVYYRLTPLNTVDLIVGIFVDDGIVCATNEQDLDAVIKHLASMFKVTHGPMDYYVGFQVHRNPVTHSILINQARYISDILQRFQLDTANPVSTPADTHNPLQVSQGPDDTLLPPSVPYREAVGCLMYAMVLTRPDIAFAVSRVASLPTPLAILTGQL